MSNAVSSPAVLDSTRPAGPASDRHIAVILPRGEAIRNFVYSRALDELHNEAQLSVLSVVPSGEFRDLLTGRYEAFHQLEAFPEPWVVRITREVLDMAHGRVLWSQAAQDRWKLRDLEAVDTAEKIKRIGKKLLCYPFTSQAGLSFLTAWERNASQWFRGTEHYVDLFRKMRPSLVFNGSHVHSQVAIQVIHAAQALGIPTATFLFSWDNLTSQGRLIPLYDHYLVWNEAIKADLLRIYPSIRAEQVRVVGTPQFDFHFRPEFHCSREEYCARVGADPRRPIVVYSTGMANHMPGEHVVVERIADLLKEFTEFGPPQLLVRLYAKDLTNRFDELRNRRRDILFPEVAWEKSWLTPKYEDLSAYTNLLRHCALGINIASTVSLELCMMDKPVLNVGYDPPGMNIHPVSFARYYQFDHYAPVVASGGVEVAYSEDQLRAQISNALRNPGERAAQRRALLDKMFGGTLDGHSSNRVSQALLQLASRS